MANQTPISPDLLAILRDPKAIQEGDKYGADPGRLTLVRDAWLVSSDTGYKYPIRDGIPVMLVEEGARWKDTPVEKLPVLPPPALPEPVTMSSGEVETRAAATVVDQTQGIIAAVAGVAVLLLALFFLWRLFAGRREQG